MMRIAASVSVTVIGLAALGGCGGKETTTVTTTVAVTETVTATQTPTTSESVTGYDPGFPKEVRLSSVPERMSLEFEGARTTVAVAPGVWTRRNPGTTAKEDADSGPLIGWCSSVDKFQKKTGRDDPVTCW